MSRCSVFAPLNSLVSEEFQLGKATVFKQIFVPKPVSYISVRPQKTGQEMFPLNESQEKLALGVILVCSF